jgi:glycerol uptake facilitator-like aquaporin
MMLQNNKSAPNPAVTIAQGFSNTFAGIQPVDIAAFVGVQLLAACLATFFFQVVTGRIGFFDDSI